MAGKPLTVAGIKCLKPQAKEYRVSDGQQLYLVVKPSGRKVWVLQYALKGQRHRLLLGEFGDPGEIGRLSLAAARETAEKMRAQIRAGIDPLSQQDSGDEAPKTTFRKLYEAWLHVHRHRDDGSGWSEAHEYRCRRLGEMYLYETLGSREPQDIKRAELIKLLMPIWEEKPQTGLKLLTCLTLAFRHGIVLELLDVNPCSDIRIAMPSLPPQEHFAAVKTPDEAGRLMRAIYAYRSRIVRAAMLFHAWTAGRSAEVCRAKWSEINMDEALWLLPENRMKARRAHLVPLPRQCMDMLRDMQPGTSADDYIFRSCRSKKRHISEDTVRVALRSMGWDNTQMTTHGFRTMFSTLANASGLWIGDAIEAQIAHASGDIIRRIYNQSDCLEQRRKLVQWWADYLDELRAQTDAVATTASSLQ
ncbi:MAG: tyrosine-type recombinase/integrase [Desulfovibrio sp.]|nr:tyrosine-type recombinase/integrase [Desulfovibrio sp.]